MRKAGRSSEADRFRSPFHPEMRPLYMFVRAPSDPSGPLKLDFRPTYAHRRDAGLFEGTALLDRTTGHVLQWRANLVNPPTLVSRAEVTVTYGLRVGLLEARSLVHVEIEGGLLFYRRQGRMDFQFTDYVCPESMPRPAEPSVSGPGEAPHPASRASALTSAGDPASADAARSLPSRGDAASRAGEIRNSNEHPVDSGCRAGDVTTGRTWNCDRQGIEDDTGRRLAGARRFPCRAPPGGGESAAPAPGWDGELPRLAEAIASAKRYVYFEAYIFRNDATGQRFAAALAAKAKEGVTVRLLYDWLGCFGVSGRLWRTLREAGVEVRVFNPFQVVSPFGWVSRDHRKTVSVDGRVAFVSGLCIGDAWAGDPAKGIPPWRDTGVQLEGPAVADVEHAFSRAWQTAGPPIPDAERLPREEMPRAGRRVFGSSATSLARRACSAWTRRWPAPTADAVADRRLLRRAALMQALRAAAL
jgi:hypothetical protein